ncbi:MAG: glucose-6-phosphate dehydrogenase [Elusimicrobia bacterium GWA2_56_46]|nr:MAG: glucose-6-phosphate dehydrogenase [Elusimicrobia bacterium GWA2_56_46]OGR56304.1 MAG: glucose-6-phosphate dehydrogenase [Elusimicrobia bacterium GWC2_56_31]HBB66452.1 glucose-6-phosphate dehydrogenase [Elusimicrobiota bacterium]HBW22494.1 glucose-6-phosphate dehydrogenase [Elusimicrobiota bacterium]
MEQTIGFCQETRPENCGFVLFGATGHLAAGKIIPALFGLCAKNLAPENLYFLFAARTELDRRTFEEHLAAAVSAAGARPSPRELKNFLEKVEYLRADYESDDFYRRLSVRLDELDAKSGLKKKRLFYLATPPAAFKSITEKLKAHSLLFDPRDCGCWSRIIIEKPYGSSLETASALDTGLKETASEAQIYRIDHFTGKETVQNVLALRAANSVFDETWNSGFIDHVQITVFEELGLEGRAGFFEKMGLARDMMSHILQLAAITAMDLPASFKDTDFKAEKRRFFESIPLLDAEAVSRQVVRAQYDGYLGETGVAAGSRAETFLAFKFHVNNDRWRGVPFYVRAGKKTGIKKTKIDLVYKKPEHGIFKTLEIGYPNIFSFEIQPAENMNFSLIAKHPGPKFCLTSRTMDLNYREHREEFASPTDYERLLIDAMAGDQTLFLSAFEVRFMWQFLSPILAAWNDGAANIPLYAYPSGAEGPKEAANLPKQDGRAWL